MTNLSIVSPDGASENQVIRSNVAKTQQPDAERLTSDTNSDQICALSPYHLILLIKIFSQILIRN